MGSCLLQMTSKATSEGNATEFSLSGENLGTSLSLNMKTNCLWQVYFIGQFIILFLFLPVFGGQQSSKEVGR
jgi:hypothetical protein